MNIIMSYIDYNMATLEDREVFSCTKTEAADIYSRLEKVDGIAGAVLIATCNRTEIYLSLDDGAEMNPFEELCKAINVRYENYSFMNKTLMGDDAIIHLCRVAAGAESQIWGDDQIVTQVSDAIKTAREHKASDTFLNVLFRTGVSAGKKAKTLVDFKVNDNSTAYKAVNVLKQYPEIKKVLVIGNGMIGRLVAELLVNEGYDTTVTLRQYKHGSNVVPYGAHTVNYSERYSLIEECDAVISATASPHFTVQHEHFTGQEKIPGVFIDLAVPRDIDPLVAGLAHVKYYNVDDISRETRTALQQEQLKEIDRIIEKYMDDFYKWYEFREKITTDK